ncbi:uncharacterized protein CLUP02_08260 [Colletotrichum lupini]|uniref:Uncharacterized protein n=1 Tax=Colletotrichum lupini TaxID=145971 RepID=A0A9Q8SST2_9PEZI|nr:uncharacterized protein CLUP02_08260 [Colletotrichum lupini]UQC82770.1 hypothetical protein CLUP02_08260 [Colletotrichum lupini]
MQVWLRMWSCSSLSSPSRMSSLPDQRQICASDRPSFKFSANLRVDPETEDTEDTTSQPNLATSSDAVLLDTITSLTRPLRPLPVAQQSLPSLFSGYRLPLSGSISVWYRQNAAASTQFAVIADDEG